MFILVIGAGIGGLSAAAALLSAGHTVIVTERAARPRAGGAALTIWPNGLRALHALDLRADAVDAGWPIESSVIRTRRGRALCRTPIGEVSRDAGSCTIAIRRFELLSILLDSLPDNVVHYNMRCADAITDDDGATAIFDDGTRIRADLVIGADGLHSAVRTAIAGNARPRRLGYVLYRAVAELRDPALLAGHAFESWARGRRFGMVQTSEDHAYWYAGVGSRRARAIDHNPRANLCRIFRRWHAPILDAIESTPPGGIIRTEIFDRPPLRKWTLGRIALLGDAAHPMSPDLGQGACSALEDAVSLAAALDAEPTPELALHRYETDRLDRTRKLAGRSHFMGRMGQLRAPGACLIRDVATYLTPPAVVRRSLAACICA